MANLPSLSGTANNQNGESNLQKTSSKSPDWSEVCQCLLDRFLPCTAVQTQPGLSTRHPSPIPRALEVLAGDQAGARTKTYGPTEFLDSLLDQSQKKRKKVRFLAILGQSGAGKTLFLRHFAQGLLQKYQEGQSSCLPIWLTRSFLKQTTVKNYLFGPWLEQVAQENPEISLEVWRRSLAAGLKAGKFWLVLDGVDHIFSSPEEIPGAKGPLSWMEDCLGELPKTPILLSCRPESRHNDSGELADFTYYDIREFTYPNDVEMAIEDYFVGTSPGQNLEEGAENDFGVQKENTLAVSLNQSLRETTARHLRKYLLCPRRLMLCCRFWQDQPGHFPNSAAELYGKLTTAFYGWQGEWVETSPSQQKELGGLLGKLAKQMLLQNHGDDCPLPPGDIENIFGKESPSLRLAVQLGWLIPKGIISKGVWERGYGFADPTFRDYFAALAITDWRFFLDIYGQHYRIFEQEWQRVLQFWWGREDIELEQKKEFALALLNFDDRCSPENFYGLQALQRLALALVEIPDLPQGNRIVERLLDYGLPSATPNFPRQQWASGLLEQIHRPLVVQALLKTLATTEDDKVYRQCCQWLGQWAESSPQTIMVLGEQLELQRESTLRFPVA